MTETNAGVMVRALLFGAAAGVAACSAEPPANFAELPAVVDGPGGEAWLTWHPEGRLVLFGRHDENWQNHRLFMTRYIDGAWSEPEPVSFTADFTATSPHFALDGRSVLFASTRPLPTDAPPAEGESPDMNIWRASWDGTSWGEPQPLPATINSPAAEIDAVEVASGVIYFSSMREGGNGRLPDLYKAVPEGADYRIEPLTTLNTDHTESTLFVTPDESLLVFHRQEDPVGLGKDDLFFSWREGDGWSAGVHLGGETNSPEYEYGPEVSPDGSTLYFTTHRSGQAGVMAVNLIEAMGR